VLKINKLYNKDCFEFLKEIDDKSVDLAIIDPPYNKGKEDWDSFKNHEEFLSFTFSWIDALFPKLKENSSLYVFNTAYNSAFILPHISQEMDFKNWIIWNKRDGFGPTKRRYVTRQETILFFTRGNNYTFNADEIRVPYESKKRIKHARSKGILKNGKRWHPNPKGKLCGDVWHFSSARHKNKVNGKTRPMKHPTPKPVDLIERMVRASSNQGDLVLDCFIGTGATAIAAKKLKRNFIGCDSNKSYVTIAKNRLKEI
jgi:site-specific DNA-methyltransferase (adenine-specific)